MAYQFADGFDNYGNALVLSNGYPWDLNSASCVTSTADFRFAPPGSLPGGCVNCGGGGYLRKNLNAGLSTVLFGFGFKIAQLPLGTNGEVMAVLDSGTIQVTLQITPSGALRFYRNGFGSGAAIGAITPNGTIVANQWYGFAGSITISSTVGAVSLFINGAAGAAINSTGLNTQVSGNATANQIEIGSSVNQGGAKFFDDFYCFDTTGGTLNSLPATDIRIITKLPSGAGNYTNWTPTGLGANWQNAAVTPPNTSDYNANSVGGTKDSYALPVISLNVAPAFVVARASLTKDDANTHTPSIFVRSGATDGTGTATPALTSSYAFYDAVQATDPATGIAWTAGGVDAAQIGVIEG